MQLTSIGESNIDAFQYLMPGIVLNDSSLFVGAIEDEKAVGAAVLSGDSKLITLEYIYVLQDYRKKGIGTALVTESAKAMEAKHIAACFSDDEKSLPGFFESLGFLMSDDAESYSVPVKFLLESEHIKKMLSSKRPAGVKSVAELRNAEKQLLFNKLSEERGESILFDAEFDPQLSFVTISPDSKEITSYILCEKMENVITIMFLRNYSGNAAELMILFAALAQRGSNDEYADCDICFVTQNEGVTELMKKLVGEIKPGSKFIYAIK